MATPLYGALKDYAKKTPLRLHIPGHKGKQIPSARNLLPLDVTELSTTGNLYEIGEPFATAQQLWADQFGLPHCQFLTGGSTQGVYTALAMCGGDTILMDRYSHRSVSHGAGLLGINPLYLRREWMPEFEVSKGIDPDVVDKMMEAHPEVKTVVICSPTMVGVLSDVYTIAQVVHSHGGKLIVDGAHGAHFPWLMIDHYSSADVVVLSAHKTLPCLGQSAMILYRDFDPQQVADTASLFGTSSPSYPILASMDLAREWMDGDGMMEYVRVARLVATLREIFPTVNEPLQLDPTRLTILCPHGLEVAKALEEENIFLEMATKSHLVAVFTAMDTDQEVQRFAMALVNHMDNHTGLPDLSPPPELPPRRMSLQDALRGKKISIPLQESLGRVAAYPVAPYPPGIPVVEMGEEITQSMLDYLDHIGYDKTEVMVVEETL